MQSGELAKGSECYHPESEMTGRVMHPGYKLWCLLTHKLGVTKKKKELWGDHYNRPIF